MVQINLLKEIIKGLKPTDREKKEIEDRISKFINKITIKGAKAILGGSGAKQTWLKGQFDADIFIVFDYKKFTNKDISKILKAELKKRFKNITEVHGSRDYFQVSDKDFLFEVIPILKISRAEQAMNITDVSPLHAGFVKKNTNEKLRDEIRLMKQFCKAQGIYGAESYIKGFSGYVCELLLIYNKSFINLLKNSRNWKPGQVIDIRRYWKGKNIFMEINKSKLQSPLIVIDPVQKDRNAAAALCLGKFNLFKKRAEEFLKKPSGEFFVKREITLEEIKGRAKKNWLITLNAVPAAGKEDVVGSRLLKAFDYIKKQLEENSFIVIDSGWMWDKKKKAMFWYIIKKERLSDYVQLAGPPVGMKQHAKNFRKKYKRTFVGGGRVCAKVKRKFREPSELLVFLVKKDSYLKEKAAKLVM